MIKSQELFDEAVLLPVEIRTQLVDKLLRSLHPTQKEIDELWDDEAEKRVVQIKNGKAKTVAGEEVFKKIRKGLTINNLDKFVVQRFEDQTLSWLKPNADKTVTNPSLKAGVSGYTYCRGFSHDGTAKGKKENMYNYKKYVHNFIRFLYIIIFYILLSHVLSLSFAGEQDKIFWDKKYETETYIFGKEPVGFLREHIDLLPRGN